MDTDVHFDYHAAGRLADITMPTGRITLGYEASTGKLNGVEGPMPGQSLSFTHDGHLPTATVWLGPVSGTVQRTYDNFFRISSEIVNGAFSIPYTYDSDGLLTKAGTLTLTRHATHGLLTGTSIGNVVDSYTYDAYGQVATYTARSGGTTLYSYSLTRDLLGRITRKVESADGVTHTYEYGYDTRGRLTDVSIDGQFAEGYEYDANGNRTALVKPGSRTSAYYDAQDRLLAFGNTQYTYTANGELRTKTDSSGTTTYTYDAMGSLLRVELTNGKLVEYIVDAEGRRIAKKVDGATERKWLYRDSLKPIAELDASGNVTAVYGYAEKYTTPSFVERDGQRYRVISDHLGSPRLVVNAADSANRPVLGEYGAFGEVNGSGLEWMPFGFAGGIYDADTGLVRFGARDYDPVAGRWTGKDPVRFKGGLNMYTYAANDPINLIDPTGLLFLEYEIATGMLLVDPELPGRRPYRIRASSGRGPYMNDPSASSIRDYGPIPPGQYMLNAHELQKLNAWGSLLRLVLGYGDWGSFRVPLHSYVGTDTLGRHGFKLHGGILPGSAGCIDVGGSSDGNPVTERLLADIAADRDGTIPLIVY